MSTNAHGCSATDQIHAGYEPAGPHFPVAPPIHQTAAYAFPDYESARSMFALRKPGFTYTRTGNPTVAVLEQRLATLEGGTGAIATATGQSAVAIALLALLGGGRDEHGARTPAGRHLVASSQLYGGTVDLLTDTFADFGITVDFVDPAVPGAWADAITADTRAVLLESITNPLATLPDLRAIAAAAHRAGVPVVVDNTLATPALYRPIEHGADIVVHSATKFLGGHGAALAGAVVDSGNFDFAAHPDKWPQLAAPKARYGNESLADRHGRGAYLALARSKYLHDLGPSLSPASAAEILRGIETLGLRVARHASNTERIARFLSAHPAVARVHHPSVPDNVGAAIAARDFPRGAGSVFSFDLAAPAAAVGPFIDSLRVFVLAANLGDTRSLVAHPAAMTHCRLTPEQRAAAGIAETTIRISVGLEEPADLIADLDAALSALAPGHVPGAAPVGVPAFAGRVA
ncbi:O-acetylhomoserine aminocarboxypropyltransferase/cysteine synthase family protein [Arthrobacter sp. KK5.5]|uniref:O-acetylhomoserine aminocarboxypropyltransferase/cysteine synthase family protein n=1 Tax=Arthrobacter sp. KK5.5 TaxID=3373084 RepID=UPI003EE69247